MIKSFCNWVAKVLAAPVGLSGRLMAAVSLIATVLTVMLMTMIGPALLTGVQRYDDLVVGEITFADTYKHGDIVAPFVAVLFYFCVWWLAALLAARLSGAPEEARPPEESSVQWLPCLFLCYYTGLVLFRKDAAVAEIGISFLLLVVYLLFLKLCLRQRDQEVKSFALLAGVVAAGGLFFSAAGLGVALKFFSPQAIFWYPAQFPLYAGGAGLLSVLFLVRFPARRLRRMAHAAQLLTPLLLLAPFTRVYDSGAGVTGNLTPLSTKCLATALSLALLFAGVRLFLRKGDVAAVRPRDLLLLPSVVAVSSYMAYGVVPFLSTDMFHIGELLLAWQQPFELGQFPFSGFAVARGFGDSMPGLVNALLFDGTFATFMFGASVYSTSFAVLIALLLCTLLGNGWGIAFVLAGAWSGGPFLSVLLLLVQPKLLARPLLWLFVWVLACPLLCLYHTTAGIALTMGTFPVAAWVVYTAIRGGDLSEAWRRARPRLLVGAALAIAALGLLLPLIIAWVTYVLEQGKVNEVANGTALLRELALPVWFRWQSRWVWEGFRVGGWIIGIFLLWHLFVRERSRQLRSAGTSLVGTVETLALAGIVSTLAYIPYSMGRIDSKGLSRTGAVTIFVLCVVLPLVLVLRKKGKPALALFAAVFLLGVGNSACYESPAALARKAVQAVAVPVGAQWTEGRSISPLFGDTFADGETLSNVMALKGVTDRVILPGESYLDLTNHVGYYYLLNYKVPAVYAGYYTVASEDVQNRVIRALRKDPPPLVWAGPARTFGSGTASLRSYRLYRWLLQNGYVPMQANGLQFLVREDRYKALFDALPPLSQQVRDLSATFNNGYLGGIPLAWGRNMDRLAPRFRQGNVGLRQTAQVQGEFRQTMDVSATPVVVVELTANESFRGGENDFMLLRFSGASGPVQVRASWSEAGNPFEEWRSVVFAAHSGAPLLIPLGSHPDWLLSGEIGKMRFEVIGMERAGDLVLEPPVFLSLVK